MLQRQISATDFTEYKDYRRRTAKLKTAWSSFSVNPWPSVKSVAKIALLSVW